MSDVKWIKLTTDMFEDEKIRLIEQMPEADTILIIWVKLLTQAGKANTSGYIFLSENIPYTEEMLATIFNRPLNTVRLALNTLQGFGMIDIDNDSFISIRNWEKHQNIEGLERIREQTRLRVAKHREQKKLKQPKNNVTQAVTLRNATELDLELDLELEEELELESNKDIVPKPISKDREIYVYYLSKNIINHNKMTSAMQTAINARLKDYTKEQLIQAIDNYATVYFSDDYWFAHKYGLADLMRDKDIRRFIDDAEPLSNYLDNKVKNAPELSGYIPGRDAF